MKGSVELAARIGAEDDVAVDASFSFFAEGVGLGREFVAGDGEGFAESGEVGEDNGAGRVFRLVRDGEGAAQHGGEATLELGGGGLFGGSVTEDDDFVWESGVTGGVGDGGVAQPALGAVFGAC